MNVIPIHRPTLSLSAVYISYDVSDAKGRVLPIGVFGEIEAPYVRGLGLIARKQLTADETAGLSALARELLARPFDLLAREFDLAWENSRTGAAMQFLRARHFASLWVAEPSVAHDIPPLQLEETPLEGGGLESETHYVEAYVKIESYFALKLENEMLRIVWNESNTFQQFGDRQLVPQRPSIRSSNKLVEWDKLAA